MLEELCWFMKVQDIITHRTSQKEALMNITEITFVFLLLSKIHTHAVPLEGTCIDEPKFGNVKNCRQL